MRYFFLIGTLFLLLNSCSQTSNSEIEPILLKCLIQSYQNKQVDINKELDKLKDYLIENGSLKSSSGQSYYDFFNQIVELNDIPVSLDDDKFEGIYKLTPDEFYTGDCLEQLKSIDSTIILKSRYYQMTVAIQKASANGATPSKIASAITSVLTPSDFEETYYRDIALLTIAFASDSDKGLFTQLKSKDNINYTQYKSDYKAVKRKLLDSLMIDICLTKDIEFMDLYPRMDSIFSDKGENLILVDSLKTKGFKVTNWGRGNWVEGPRIITFTLSNGQCECQVDKLYYTTEQEPKYKVTERIKCSATF